MGPGERPRPWRKALVTMKWTLFGPTPLLDSAASIQAEVACEAGAGVKVSARSASMAFRQDDLGTPRTPPAPAEPSGNWDLFRGIAARESASAARSRKLIRIGALCLLVLGVSVGLTMMVLRLRNRIPSLYSAARAEVVSVAAKFR